MIAKIDLRKLDANGKVRKDARMEARFEVEAQRFGEFDERRKECEPATN